MLFVGFVQESAASGALCARFSPLLPPALTAVWQKYGFGTVLDGYLKVVNPEDYQDLLQDTYALGGEAIPIFATAFADLITWEKGRYIRMVKYREGVFQGVAAGFDFFWEDVESGAFDARFFDLELYQAAVRRWGPLQFGQCFCFVPLLGLGGRKEADCLRKGNIKEQIELIRQFFGRVGDDL